MKNFIFTFCALALGITASGQQTTLQHFDPATTTPVVQNYPNNAGFFTGHNNYGDEEFGEKYEITGSAKLYGISAIHLGTEGTAGSIMASYKAYSVGNTGLPGTSLATKTMSYSNIPVNGQLNTVLFDTAVTIPTTFFVTFALGDYMHGGLGTKRIAVSHSPQGSRPSSDFSVFGRNVIRWHSHGAPVWKDYRTQNFSDYSPEIYFSLFPIIELDNMSVVNFEGKGNIGAVYPNPSNGNFTVPVQSESGGEVQLKLFDITGKLVVEKNNKISKGKAKVDFSENNLKPGIYILWIKTPEGAISQKINIK